MTLLRGSIIAVVTPMTSNGEIDYESFSELLRWQLVEGCDGIVVAGSTGESATLSHDEKLKLFAFALSEVDGEVPVIASTGSNDTHASIALTQAAANLGIEMVLLICPYYNKPTQKGIYAHFQAIAGATPNVQHILYNNPARCVVNMENETIVQLSKIPNIMGLKDSGTTKERIRFLRAACGPQFTLYSGDDDFTLDCIASGGDGAISMVANALPLQMQTMVQMALSGRWEEAKKINEQFQDLFRCLAVEPNPIPIKALLFHMDKISKAIRLPLTWLSEEYRQPLLDAFAKI